MNARIQIPDAAMHVEFDVAIDYRMAEPKPFVSFTMLDNGECIAMKPNGSRIVCPDIETVYMPAYDRREKGVNAL